MEKFHNTFMKFERKIAFSIGFFCKKNTKSYQNVPNSYKIIHITQLKCLEVFSSLSLLICMAFSKRMLEEFLSFYENDYHFLDKIFFFLH